jgi:hypothetical protein
VKGAAHWDGATRTLRITTSAARIEPGAKIALSVSDVVTPPSVRVSSFANLTTFDLFDRLIDGPTTLSTNAIVAGTPSGALTWSPVESYSPGVTTSVTVSFTAVGHVRVGGAIVISLPDDGWIIRDDSRAQFALPSRHTTSVPQWNASTRQLTLSIYGVAIGEGAATSFVLHNVETPPSVRSSAQAEINCYDTDTKLVAGPSQLAVSPVRAGTFGAGVAWVAAASRPQLVSTVSIILPTAGKVPAGGTFTVVLPPTGWSMVAKPNVSSTTHNSSIVRDAVWNATTRELAISVTNTGIPEGSSVEVTIEDIATPPSVRGASTAAVTSRDDTAQVIDGATNIMVPAVVAGSLAGNLSWVATIETPGTLSSATVSFDVSGMVAVGGYISILLPDEGWSLQPTPTVTFSAPSSSTLGTAVWGPSNRTLAVKVGGQSIPMGSTVKFTVYDVGSPPSARAPMSFQLKTMDSVSNVIDGPNTLTTNAITAGILAGTLSLTSDIVTAAVTTNSTVLFKNTGEIGTGGFIVLRLPSDWNMPASPAVHITGPVAVSGAATWSYALAKLTVKVTHGKIPRGSSVVLMVEKTVNPPSVRAASTGSVTSLDAFNRTIDGPSKVSVNAIAAAELAALSWVPTVNKPGFKSSTKVAFTVSGSLSIGGSVRIVLPDDGWAMPHAPTVLFTKPTAAVSGQATWDAQSRTFVLAISSQGIPEKSDVLFEIQDTVTPPSVRNATSASCLTQDQQQRLVDGPTMVNISAISEGAVSGPLAWNSAVDTPGVTSTSTVTFDVHGAVPSGGSFVIDLPDDGWLATGSSTVTITRPAKSVFGRLQWSSSLNRLSIATSGGSIPQSTRIVLEISNVRSPPSERPPSSATIRTFDSAAVLVDRSVALVTNAITPGALSGKLALVPDITSGGMTSNANVSFVATGGIPSGGEMQLNFTDHDWSMPSAPTVTLHTVHGSSICSAVWQPATHSLVVTTSSEIAEGSAAAFEVSNVLTPSYARAQSTVAMGTRDANNFRIDGPTNGLTSAITPGTIFNATWDSAIDTPSMTSVTTLSFSTSGAIRAGSSVKVVLPSDAWAVGSSASWDMPAKPTVQIVKPSGVSAVGVWDSVRHTLLVTTSGSGIPELSEVVVTVQDVKSPTSVRPATSAASITTIDAASSSSILDGPNAVAVNAVVPGSLAGAQRWKPAIMTPGVTSSATVSFNTTGEIGIGGAIDIALPADGWTMPYRPVVTFAKPSPAVTAGSTSWDFRLRRLTVVIQGASIPVGSAVQFKIGGVKTPLFDTPAHKANVTTFDVSGSAVDMSEALVTDPIVTAQYTSHWLAGSPPTYSLVSSLLPALRMVVKDANGNPYASNDPEYGLVVCVLFVAEFGGTAASAADSASMLRGNVNVPLVSGVATFYPLHLDYLMGTSIALNVNCSGRGAFSTLSGSTILQNITIEWVARPETHLVASKPGYIAPINRPVQLRLLNHTGGLMSADTTTRCRITVARSSGTVGPVTLLSSSEATAASGIISFDSLAVKAEFGTVVKFTASCERELAVSTEVIVPISSTSVIEELSSRWHQVPAYVLTGVDFVPVLKVEILNHTGERYANDVRYSPKVHCAVSVSASTTPLSEVFLLGNIDSYAVAGIVTFEPLAIRAALGAVVTLRTRCDGANRLDDTFGQITVQNVTAIWTTEPGNHILNEKVMAWSNDGEMSPAFEVEIRNHTAQKYNGVAPITCRIGVNNSQASAREVAFLGNKDVVALDGIARFRGLALSAPMGTTVTLKAQCWSAKMLPLYQFVPIYSTVRTQVLTVAWQDAPPAQLIASESGLVAPLARPVKFLLLNETGDVVHADSSGTCLLSAAPADKSSGNVTLLSSPEAVFSKGVATYNSIAVAADFLATVRFSLKCQRKLIHSVENITAIHWTTLVQKLSLRWLSKPASVVSSEALHNLPMTIEVLDTNGARYLWTPQLTCVATVAGTDAPSSDFTLTGVTTVVSIAGIADFDQLTISGPLDKTMEIIVTCSGANQLIPLRSPVRMQRLTIAWRPAPPALIPASALGLIAALPEPVKVVVMNESMTVMNADSTGRCFLSVASLASDAVSLLSTPEAVLDRGVATFDSIAVRAPQAAPVRFTMRCQRELVTDIEFIPAITWDAVIQNLTARWHFVPEYALNNFTIAPSIQIEILNHTGGRYTSEQAFCHNKMCPPVQCRLDVSSPNGASAMFGNTNEFDEDGIVTFSSVSLQGPLNTQVALRASCAAGRSLLPIEHPILIGSVFADWIIAPPAYIVASSPDMLNTVSASVGIFDVQGPSKRKLLTDDSLTRCEGDVRVVSDEPLGTRPAALLFAANKVVQSGRADFADLAVSARMGLIVEFRFTCFWAGTETPLKTLVFNSTVQSLSAHWFAPPPTTVLSDQMPNLPLKIEIRNHTGAPYSGKPSVACSVEVESASVPREFIYLTGDVWTSARGGHGDFSPLSIAGPLGSTVVLRVACFAAVRLTYLHTTVTIQDLKAEWVQKPPAWFIASVPGLIAPINKPVKIKILNATGQILVSDNTATCVLSAKNFQSPSKPVTILSPTESVVHNGIATFEAVAIKAPFGTKVELSFNCARKVHRSEEKIPTLTHLARVQKLTSEWLFVPQDVLSDNIINPPIQVGILNQFGKLFKSTRTVSCAISVNAADNIDKVLLYGSKRAFPVLGIVTFAPLVMQAPEGEVVQLKVVCHTSEQFETVLLRSVKCGSTRVKSKMSMSGFDSSSFQGDAMDSMKAAILAQLPIDSKLTADKIKFTGIRDNLSGGPGARRRLRLLARRLSGASNAVDVGLALDVGDAAAQEEASKAITGISSDPKAFTSSFTASQTNKNVPVPAGGYVSAAEPPKVVHPIEVDWGVKPAKFVVASSPTHVWRIPDFTVQMYERQNTSRAIYLEDNATMCEAVPTVAGGVQTADYVASFLTASSTTVALGLATFANLSLSAPLGALVDIQVSCYYGGKGRVLNQLMLTSTVQDLTIAWAAAAPSFVIADHAGNLPLAVEVRDHAGARFTDEPNVDCNAEVYAADVPAKDVMLSGNTTTVSAAGIVAFDRLSLTGPLGANVTIRVRCWAALQLPPIFHTVSVRNMHISWLTSPPSLLVSSSHAFMAPISAPIRVEMLDGNSLRMTGDSSSKCTLGSNTTVLSSTTATMVSGVATFPDFAVDAAFNTGIQITAVCTQDIVRSNQVIAPIKFESTVQNLTARWSVAPPPVVANGVHNLPFSVNVLDHMGELYSVQQTISCQARAFGREAALSGTTSINAAGGVANFSAITLTAPMGEDVVLQVTCANAKQLTPINSTVRLQNVSIEWTEPPPHYVLRSSPGVVAPISAPVMVALKDASTGKTQELDNSTLCTMAIIAEQPANAAVALISPAEVLMGQGVARFGSVAVQADFGTVVQFTVTCERDHGALFSENIPAISKSTTVQNMTSRWVPTQLPPTALLSDKYNNLPLIVEVLNHTGQRCTPTSCPVAITCTATLNRTDARLDGDSTIISNSGLFSFTSLSLIAAPNVAVTVGIHCHHSFALPPIYWSIRTLDVAIGWSVEPPTYMVASTPDLIVPLSKAMVVSMLDDAQALNDADDSTLCELNATSMTPGSGPVKLIGQTGMRVQGGVATFDAVGIQASPATAINLTAQCVRKVHSSSRELLTTTTHIVTIQNLTNAWLVNPPFDVISGQPGNLQFSVQVTNHSGGLHTGLPLPLCRADVMVNPISNVNGKATLVGNTDVYAENGLAVFDLMLQAPSSADVNLNVTCSYSTNAFPPISWHIQTKTISVEWQQPPPKYLLGSSMGGVGSTSSAGILSPIARPIEIKMVNERGNVETSDSSTLCKIVVSRALGYTGRAPKLLSAPEMTMAKGIASFDSLAVAAERGARVLLTATCVPATGGSLNPLTKVATVQNITARWFDMLENRPHRYVLPDVKVDPPLQVEILNHTSTLLTPHRYTKAQPFCRNTTCPKFHCVLSVDSHNASQSNVWYQGVHLTGTVAAYEVEGRVIFPELFVHAPTRTKIVIKAQCTGASLLTPIYREITTSDIYVEWVQRPQDYVLSSSNNKMSVIDPPVALVIKDRNRGGGHLTDMASTVLMGDNMTKCVASVVIIGGNTTRVSESTGIATIVELEAANSMARFLSPIEEAVMVGGNLNFPSLAVSGDMGGVVQLTFTCYWQGTGQKLVELHHVTQVQDLTAKWLVDKQGRQLPQATVLSGEAFSPELVVDIRNHTGDPYATLPKVLCELSINSSNVAASQRDALNLLGNTVVEANGGLAKFKKVKLEGPLGTSVVLRVDCVSARKLEPVFSVPAIGVGNVSSAWKVQLPEYIYASSAQVQSEIVSDCGGTKAKGNCPLRVAILDGNNGIIEQDNSTRCRAILRPSVPQSIENTPRILTATDQRTKRGVAIWEPLAIWGPHGLKVIIEMKCFFGGVESVGSTIKSLESSTTIQGLHQEWVDDSKPNWVLTGTSLPSMLKVKVLNHTDELHVEGPIITCKVEEKKAWGTSGIATIVGTYETQIRNGFANFEVFWGAKLGSVIPMQIRCESANHLNTLDFNVTLQDLTLHWLKKPAAYVHASPTAKRVTMPMMKVELRNHTRQTHVQQRPIICDVSVWPIIKTTNHTQCMEVKYQLKLRNLTMEDACTDKIQNWGEDGVDCGGCCTEHYTTYHNGQSMSCFAAFLTGSRVSMLDGIATFDQAVLFASYGVVVDFDITCNRVLERSDLTERILPVTARATVERISFDFSTPPPPSTRIGPGEFILPDITVEVRDHFMTRWWNHSSTTCTAKFLNVSNTNGPALLGATEIELKRGRGTWKSLGVQGSLTKGLGTTHTMEFKCFGAHEMKAHFSIILFRECDPGEEPSRPLFDRCLTCKPGEFSRTGNNDDFCLPCPEGAVCTYPKSVWKHDLYNTPTYAQLVDEADSNATSVQVHSATDSYPNMSDAHALLKKKGYAPVESGVGLVTVYQAEMKRRDAVVLKSGGPETLNSTELVAMAEEYLSMEQVIGAAPGFYTTSSDLNEYYKCNLDIACLGKGTEQATGVPVKAQCKFGHRRDFDAGAAPLCQGCETGYALQGGICEKCPAGVAVILYSGSLIIAIAFLGLVAFKLKKYLPVALLKILLSFSSIMGGIVDGFNIPFPAAMRSFISQCKAALADVVEVTGLGCIGAINHYQKLMIVVFGTAGALVFITISVLWTHHDKRAKLKQVVEKQLKFTLQRSMWERLAAEAADQVEMKKQRAKPKLTKAEKKEQKNVLRGSGNSLRARVKAKGAKMHDSLGKKIENNFFHHHNEKLAKYAEHRNDEGVEDGGKLTEAEEAFNKAQHDAFKDEGDTENMFNKSRQLKEATKMRWAKIRAAVNDPTSLQRLLEAEIIREAEVGLVIGLSHGLLLVLTAAYPAVAVKCFQTLHCVKIDTRAFIAIDMTLECYTEEWYQWTSFCWIVIIVYIFAFPLVLASFLFRFRSRITNESHPYHTSFTERYGFLWKEYGRQCYFYAPMDMMRACFLTSFLPALITGVPTTRAASALVMAMVAHVAHGTFKPYMNTLEEEKKQRRIHEFEANLMMNRALLKEVEHKSPDIKRLKELAVLPKGPRSRQLYSHLFAERMMLKNKKGGDFERVTRLEQMIRNKEQSLLDLHGEPNLVDRQSYQINHLILFAMTTTYLGGLMVFCGTPAERAQVGKFVTNINFLSVGVVLIGSIYGLLQQMKAYRENKLWLLKIEEEDGNINTSHKTKAQVKEQSTQHRKWTYFISLMAFTFIMAVWGQQEIGTKHSVAAGMALVSILVIITLLFGSCLVKSVTRSTTKRHTVKILFTSTHRHYGQTTCMLGAKHYIDRATHYISKLPHALNGAILIRTAQSDRNTASTTTHLKFFLKRPSCVYVCFNSTSNPPKWLSPANGWDKTAFRIHEANMLGEDNDFLCYMKTVPGGIVTLYGNGIADHQYFVVIKKANMHETCCMLCCACFGRFECCHNRKKRQEEHLKQLFEEDDGMDELERNKEGKFITHHSDAAKKEMAEEAAAAKEAAAAAAAEEGFAEEDETKEEGAAPAAKAGGATAAAAAAAAPMAIMRVKGGKATAVIDGKSDGAAAHPKLQLFQPKGGKSGGFMQKLAKRAPLKSLQITIAHGKELAATGKDGFSDPYCMVYWNKKRVGKTKVKRKTVNPVWDGEVFKVPYPEDVSGCVMRIELWDKGAITSEWLGMVEFAGDALEEKALPADVFDYGVLGDTLKYKTKWKVSGKLGVRFELLDAPAARFLMGQDVGKKKATAKAAAAGNASQQDAKAGAGARAAAMLDMQMDKLNPLSKKYGAEGVSVGKEQERVFSRMALAAKDSRREASGEQLSEREQRLKAGAALQKLREQRLAQKRAIEASGGKLSKKAERMNKLLEAGTRAKAKEETVADKAQGGLEAITGTAKKKKKKAKAKKKGEEMLSMAKGGGASKSVGAPKATKKVVL